MGFPIGSEEDIMTKASRSIGLDDAGGLPRGTPNGPYITDRTDDSRQRKRGSAEREPPPSRRTGAPPHEPPDLAGRRKGPAQP